MKKKEWYLIYAQVRRNGLRFGARVENAKLKIAANMAAIWVEKNRNEYK